MSPRLITLQRECRQRNHLRSLTCVSSGRKCVEARCVRRAAGVRRDVAVAGRGAGGRARAAARVGAARRPATQVPRTPHPHPHPHASICVLHVAPALRGAAVLRGRSPRLSPAAPAHPHPLQQAVLPRAAFASPLHAYAPVYYDPFLAAAATADSNYRLQAAAAAAAAAAPLLKSPLTTAQHAAAAAAAANYGAAARAVAAAVNAAPAPTALTPLAATYGREYADPYLGHGIGPVTGYGTAVYRSGYNRSNLVSLGASRSYPLRRLGLPVESHTYISMVLQIGSVHSIPLCTIRGFYDPRARAAPALAPSGRPRMCGHVAHSQLCPISIQILCLLLIVKIKNVPQHVAVRDRCLRPQVTGTLRSLSHNNAFCSTKLNKGMGTSSQDRWASRGGFNLASPARRDDTNERRETIVKLPEMVQDVQDVEARFESKAANGNVAHFKKSITLPVDSAWSSKKSSYVSIQSDKSTGSINNFRDSDSDERKSSAGRKTISDLVQSDPQKQGRRKRGIIAPHAPFDTGRLPSDLNYEKFTKDEKSAEQIKKAIMANDFLRNIMDEERLYAVVEAMSSQEFPAGSLMIREGESGSHLYVSAHGQFEVLKGGQVVKNFGPGEAFGELAILYKAKRFASIRCITEAKVWTLERRVFQKIMVRSGRQEQEDNVRFLSSVPLLQGIHPIELAKIADFLKREFFSAGTAVVRQGDHGDKFYIIRGGTVVVTKREEDGDERRVGALRRGDYFGEQALLHEDRRLATVTALPPGVECLTLERGPFTELLGNLGELKNVRHSDPRPSQQKKTSVIKSEYQFVELKDLEIVGTMGVGGFGRVELVQYKRNPSLTFALKCLKKVDMVQQQQQEHAFNEKNIMMICNSRFICRLYSTFKDNKYIYFLMEPVLGGDVWSILQKQRYFPENVARFMTACVVEAFQYLHSKDIIYRDLKPENLMLDKQGYIKLVDFGFAKRLTINSKTWTFAGTPEYVAPEIVLNKGHDRAVDCWALGVFVHELLVGKPPFRAPGGDHMKTYTLILRGIDAVTFHPRVPKSAQLLIRKLCRAVPAERLGYLKNGIVDIKNHKWFLGFDWEGLREGKLKAPLIQPVANDLDLSNFEKYPKDKLPPDETSGWDINF
ncbi:unnamed protein product, partial [Brenthis ino]